MQLANCEVIINEFGARVPKYQITPAEAQLLVHLHSDNAGKIPIHNLQILPSVAMALDEEGNVTKVTRNSSHEKNRLKRHYRPFSDDAKAVTVEKMFPGPTAKLPETFAEVVDKEGNPVFDEAGLVKAPKADEPVKKEVEVVTIDGKQYTKEELAKLIPNSKPSKEESTKGKEEKKA